MIREHCLNPVLGDNCVSERGVSAGDEGIVSVSTHTDHHSGFVRRQSG